MQDVKNEDWLADLRRKYGHRAELRAQKQAARAGLNAQERMLLAYYPPPVAEALVLGCGAGREVLHLAALGWRVTGVDLAAPPIAACRRALRRRGLSATLVHLEKPAPWPIPAASFGAVLLLAQVLEHLPARAERLTILREAARVLIPGGLVYLSAHAIQASDRAELSWLAKDGGPPGEIAAARISPGHSPGVLRMHLYGQEELCADVAETGFEVLSRLVHQEPGGEHPVWRRFLYLAARKYTVHSDPF